MRAKKYAAKLAELNPTMETMQPCIAATIDVLRECQRDDFGELHELVDWMLMQMRACRAERKKHPERERDDYERGVKGGGPGEGSPEEALDRVYGRAILSSTAEVREYAEESNRAWNDRMQRLLAGELV